MRSVHMKGWLVVNSFYKTEKLNTMYSFLIDSCQKRHIELEIRTGASLLCPVGQSITETYGKPDFVLFWDKDILLARRLEEEGLHVFNSARGIELADNKALTALALSGKVPTPTTIIAPKTFEAFGYNNYEFLQKAAETLGFPLVIKEVYGSFGQQVYLANDIDEAVEIVKKIGWKDFIMQQYISSSRGSDVRMNVVGDHVVCAIARHNANDFRSNISNGGTATNFPYNQKLEKLAVAATKALGLDFAGVDILHGPCDEKDDMYANPLVCEVNSNPNFKSSIDATGVDVSQHIVDYILNKLNRQPHHTK